ncbi:hypothetical protein R3P38DRAFT_3212820 [Favolaschia claudopus]|uniref:Uncharacterized protein n=1 Tax=Favolaschia claudopus TaxID=2862362 RepID=A0AAW0AD17_9AGAR
MCEVDIKLHDLLLSFGFVLVTPPDVPTHSSGNVIDLGFCSASLYIDHLPIIYSLDFEAARFKPTRLNADKMDMDLFLGTLRHEHDLLPVLVISTLDELD